MIKEKIWCVVLMVGSFFVCIISAYAVGGATEEHEVVLALVCLIAVFISLVLHGLSWSWLMQNDGIGKPIPYHMLEAGVAFRVVERIGEEYFRVALRGWDEKDFEKHAKIVKGLPKEVSNVGCVFFKKDSEAFIKPQTEERNTSWDMCI